MRLRFRRDSVSKDRSCQFLPLNKLDPHPDPLEATSKKKNQTKKPNMFKTIILVALMVIGAVSALQQEEAAPEPYNYQYETDSHSAAESKDASGKVTGYYTVADADGRQRRVDYEADEAGFRAKVQTNEVGTKSENSADVEVVASPPSQEQLVQSQSASSSSSASAYKEQSAYVQQPAVQQQQAVKYSSQQYSSGVVPASEAAAQSGYQSAAAQSGYQSGAGYQSAAGRYQSGVNYQTVPVVQYQAYPYSYASQPQYGYGAYNPGVYYTGGQAVQTSQAAPVGQANYRNSYQVVPAQYASTVTTKKVQSAAVPAGQARVAYRSHSSYQNAPVGSNAGYYARSGYSQVQPNSYSSSYYSSSSGAAQPPPASIVYN